MPTQQITFLLILGVALALFVTERLRADVTAMLVLVALALSGILSPDEALSGLSSEPALIVASVFVLSSGLAATGLAESVGALVTRLAGGSEWRAIAALMPIVAAFAAFSHHLLVIAIMLPIVMRMTKDEGLQPSRVLMPLSLAASLGTTLTIIGAPAFLLARDLLVRNGRPALGLFDITPIGVVLLAIGVAYMLLGRWLLPRRGPGAAGADYLRLDQYYTELVIEPDSPWSGRTVTEFEEKFTNRLRIAGVLRHGSARVRRSAPLEPHDVLLVRASPDEIASIGSEPGLELHAVAKYGERRDREPAEQELVQALVAPWSEFIGRTVAEIDFRRTLGVVVVGLWRKEGWLSQELAAVRLREGDVLVLWGRPGKFAELAGHRGFLMLVPFAGDEKRRHRWTLALAIMIATVVATVTGWLPAAIAFLTGAVAMVATGCVTIERAYREIDVRIFVMIVGVIPLGVAMEKTGTAAAFAGLLTVVMGEWSTFMVLLALFTAAAAFTQILSDSATVVLLGPVALGVALAMGQPPEPFVVCTALGAVASFLTPIGHHGNLLILNPGQYRFADFVRVGAPLTCLIGIASAWLAQWLWLGGPLLPGAG